MTNIPDTRTLVLACLAQTADLPEHGIDLADDLSAIGVDSLSMLRLRMTLEESFRTSLPENFELDVSTGEDVLGYIEQRLRDAED